MMPPITDKSAKLSALAALTAVGGLLAGAKVHLFANSFIPSPSMQLTDFVEATFTGYAAQAAGTFGAPYYGPDGLAHVTAPGLQFQPTDGVTPNTIYGVFVTNTGSTVLIFAARFDAPIPLVDATTGLVYEPDFIYGA